MAQIITDIIQKCPVCKCERRFKVDHAYISYWGIRHILVCTGCNTKVPDFSFNEFLQSGKITIPV